MLCGSCAGRLAAPWESTAIRSCVLARNYTIFSRHCFRLRPREGFNSEKRAKAYRWTALADVTAKRRTKHRASSIQRERERSWLIAGPTASKTASHNLRHCTTTLPNLWNRSVFQRPDLTKCVGLADGDISALGSKNDRSWTPFSLSLCTLRSFSFRAAIDHDDTIDTSLSFPKLPSTLLFPFSFLSSRVAFLCQQPHVELVEERVSERVQSWERNFPTENGIAEEEEEGKKEVDYNIEETEREKKKSIGTIVWIDSYGSLLPLFGRFHLGVGWSCYWPARESTILSPFLLLLLLKKRRKKSVGSLPRLGSAGVRENRNHAEAKRPPLARFTYMWI